MPLNYLCRKRNTIPETTRKRRARRGNVGAEEELGRRRRARRGDVGAGEEDRARSAGEEELGAASLRTVLGSGRGRQVGGRRRRSLGTWTRQWGRRGRDGGDEGTTVGTRALPGDEGATVGTRARRWGAVRGGGGKLGQRELVDREEEDDGSVKYPGGPLVPVRSINRD